MHIAARILWRANSSPTLPERYMLPSARVELQLAQEIEQVVLLHESHREVLRLDVSHDDPAGMDRFNRR